MQTQSDDWTPDRRLKLVKVIVGRNYPSPLTRDDMQRVMFLCDMPDEFLELNKLNFEDAIKRADLDLTIEL